MQTSLKASAECPKDKKRLFCLISNYVLLFRKKTNSNFYAHYHMKQDVWNSREAIRKTLLKPPVKQTEMKQISNSTVLTEPSGVDSKLELNKV